MSLNVKQVWLDLKEWQSYQSLSQSRKAWVDGQVSPGPWSVWSSLSRPDRGCLPPKRSGASVPRWCLCPQTLPLPAGIISKHVNYPQQKLKQTKHFFHFQETIWAWSINWTNLRATTSSYQYIKKKYINSSANERMKCGKNGWMTLVIVWLDLTW